MDKLLIGDFDLVLYKICFPKVQSPEEIELYGDQTKRTFEDVCIEADNYLINIFQQAGIDLFIGYLTGKKNFRRQINENYKANRKDFVKPQFFNELKVYLQQKWGFVIVEPLEADDLVLCTERLLKDKYEVIVASNDKDILYTEGNRFNLRDCKFLSTSPLNEMIYFWKSMICGDSADGLICLKGKGEAYFNKKLGEYGQKMPMYSWVLQEYILHYKSQYKGIQEFYKNYMSLKILKEYEGFEVPQIQSVTELVNSGKLFSTPIKDDEEINIDI